VGVKEQPDGLDFFYANRSHALKFVDFLQSVVAIRTRADKQLVSADHNSNTYNYKHTFCIEIVPVCKEDLVCLPHTVSKSLGGIGPVMLCTRVGNIVTLVDTSTMRSMQACLPPAHHLPTARCSPPANACCRCSTSCPLPARHRDARFRPSARLAHGLAA